MPNTDSPMGDIVFVVLCQDCEFAKTVSHQAASTVCDVIRAEHRARFPNHRVSIKQGRKTNQTSIKQGRKTNQTVEVVP